MKKLLIAALVLGFAAPVFAQAPAAAPMEKKADMKPAKKAKKAKKAAKAHDEAAHAATPAAAPAK